MERLIKCWSNSYIKLLSLVAVPVTIVQVCYQPWFLGIIIATLIAPQSVSK